MSLRSIIRRACSRVPALRRARTLQLSYVAAIRKRWRLPSESKDNDLALASLVQGRRLVNDVSSSAQMDDEPALDITVVTFDSCKWIQPFLQSLQEQRYPTRKMNLVFVDHGSRDSTVPQLRASARELGGQFASFKIIEQANLGFGAGHDRAIAASESAFVLITNVDIEFSPTAISEAMSIAIPDSQDVAAWEFRQVPFEHPKHYDPVSLETNWQSHACVLMRRSAYVRVGGYDKKIFMYGEDVELSYRIRSWGYRLRYIPSATVHHHTYLDETKLLKPLQYTGSTFANAAIRLRYGGSRERAFAVLSLARLSLKSSQPFPGVRRKLCSNFMKLLANARHFRHGKGTATGIAFPFRGFDYELTRHGAAFRHRVPARSPLVSIITRTWTRPGQEDFLRDCGRSIANQTYKRIQWVIAMDGPGDVEAEVDRIRKAAPELQISVLSLERKGRSCAGNAGLAAAEGEFCMFLDDDDLLYADHVETLMAELLQNDAATAAYGLAFEVQYTMDHGRRKPVSHELPVEFLQEWDFDVLLKYNFIPIQSIIFNRSLYEKRGGFDVSLEQLEDWNLWLRYGYQNIFVYVPKTTSLFFTPSDPVVRNRRQLELHQAYGKAKLSAIQAFSAAN